MILLQDSLFRLSLSAETTQKVLAIAHKFTAKISQRLIAPPQVCDRLFYIEDGIFREYRDIEAEAEKTTWLLGEGNWLYSVESYITAKPTEYYLQALTTAKGYYFYKHELEALLLQTPSLAYIAYKLSEVYILKLEARNTLHRLKTLPERLKYLETTQPELTGKVKGRILASYLNVKPQQLSKLRSELAKGKRM
ncbi:MAG: Crp/Fnr family transcriptional regulator [Spirosomataceae bacterium]|jgi:CRP-like cAMP-binding protein